MSSEPKRLRLESDALAASVASLQGALPSEERMAALAARLAEAGAPVDDRPLEPAPASSTFERAPAPRPAPRLLRAVKALAPETLAILAALAFGGALVATAILVREADAPLQPPPAPVPAVAAGTVHGTPTVGSPALAAAPAQPGSTPSLEANPGAGHEPSVPSPAESAHAAPAAETAAPDTAAPPSETQAQRAPDPSPVAPPAAPDSARTTAPSTRSKALAGEPGPAGGPLAENTVVESEIGLLKEARSALGADPLRAFVLSERCRAQYPSGAFAQEREYIAISALVRIGRGDEARSRASLFRMHYPNSAYLPRLARMLGE